MSDAEPDLAAAQARSANARQRLSATLVELQARLKPKALVRDAVQELREAGHELTREGLEMARRHPLTLASIATGVGLFLARRPLRALIETMPEEMPPPASPLPPKPRTRGKPR